MGLLDLIFGQKRPKYPVITNDMMQPVDNKITAADAKRMTKALFLQIGYCEDAQDARLEAESLAESMRYHEENLREEEAMLKDELDREMAEWKADWQELRDDLKASAPADRAAAAEDLAQHEEDKPAGDDWRRAKQALSDFRADKREFLIAYLNEQLHGTSDA